MRQLRLLSAIPLLVLAPLSSRGQTPAAPAAQIKIDPGMTQAQVIQRLGQPLSTRKYGSFTYLLYKNGCEQTCGMNDLVVLDSNKVVDAIFRSPTRRYTGNSSSPKMISAQEAKRSDTTAKAPPKPPAKKSPQ